MRGRALRLPSRIARDRLLVAAVAVLACAATDARAQGDPPARPATFCFRVRPAPHCRTFLLTEVSLNSRPYGLDYGVESHWQWELGGMANVGGNGAVGGTFVFGEPKNGHRGFAARYRLWSPEGIAAVDLSPGFVVVGNDYDGRYLRLTANVSITVGDWVGGFAHGESTRDGGRAGAGLKLGSWLGAIAGGALYGLFVMLPET